MPLIQNTLQTETTRPFLHITLLGGLRLVYGAEPITQVNTGRLQALLAYLLLHRQVPQSRQQLAFQFWPDSSEKQAHTNLRKLLFQLRNALPDPDQFLHYDHLTVQWRSTAPYTLDVAEIQILLAHVPATSDPTSLTRIVQLYQGELLPGCFDEWLIPIRQQLQRAVMEALEQLIHRAEHQREYRAGIRYAQRLLGLDPLHEAAYRRLMQVHALNGDRAAALHDYHTCVTLLQQELGVEPDEETHTLYQHLLKLEGQPLPPATGLVNAPLVGRAAEWRALLAAWRGAQRGQAHFVSIAGEAGMGKTRLAEELLNWASAQGVRVAHTRSYEAEGGLAYAPLAEWLRSRALKPALQKMERPWLSEVARLLPELLTEQPNLAPPTTLTESWQRQRFFEALARATLAEKAPLLLVIDDLQWCDSETLTWLRFLLRYNVQARLLIIGTWRNEAVTDQHPLHILLRDLQHTQQLTALELGPFTPDETATVAQHIAGAPLPAITLDQLYQVTAGHPLFVVETVRATLQAQGTNGASLPPKVQTVIQSRLAQLSHQAQAVVSVAATVGRRFNFALLAHAGQLGEDALVQALDELWQRRIIAEQAAGTYDFTHDRIREVVYQRLRPPQRRQLHRQVAAALEHCYADKLDGISGELAAHYEQAGIVDKARHYWQRSGAQAVANFANGEAIQHLSRALTLTASDEPALRFELLVQREAIYALQGQAEQRFTDLLTLQQLSQQLLVQDPNQTYPVIQSALLLGKYYQRAGRPEQTVISLQTAAALAQQFGERTLEAQAWFHLGDALFHQAKLAGASEALHQAIACAERAQLTEIEASANEFLAAVSMFSGAKATTIESYLQRALVLFRQRDDLKGISRVFNKLGYLPIAQGNGHYDQAKSNYAQALVIARQIGNRPGESNIWRNLGVLHTYTGDYQQARTALDAALTLDRQPQDRHSEGVTLDYLAGMQLNLGDYAGAQESLTTALSLLQQTKSAGWICKTWCDRSLLEWLQGAFSAAHTSAIQAHKLAVEVGDQRQVGYALTRCGRALHCLGQDTEALRAFEQAFVIHTALEQHNHAMAALAGSALSTLAQQDLAQAGQQVETILTHLQCHQLDRTDEGLQVYLSCYQVLLALHDPRASNLLQCAREQLQTRTATLITDEARQRFWAAPIHAAVLGSTLAAFAA